jgi:hypothetical protein
VAREPVIRSEVLTVTTTGGAGVSAGNVDSAVLNGYIEAIHIASGGTPPATTDTTVSLKDAKDNILVITNANPVGMYYPRTPVVDSAGSAITDSHQRFPVNQAINVAFAQSDDLAMTITVYWAEA